MSGILRLFRGLVEKTNQTTTTTIKTTTTKSSAPVLCLREKLWCAPPWMVHNTQTSPLQTPLYTATSHSWCALPATISVVAQGPRLSLYPCANKTSATKRYWFPGACPGSCWDCCLGPMPSTWQQCKSWMAADSKKFMDCCRFRARWLAPTTSSLKCRRGVLSLGGGEAQAQRPWTRAPAGLSQAWVVIGCDCPGTMSLELCLWPPDSTSCSLKPCAVFVCF